MRAPAVSGRALNFLQDLWRRSVFVMQTSTEEPPCFRDKVLEV